MRNAFTSVARGVQWMLWAPFGFGRHPVFFIVFVGGSYYFHPEEPIIMGILGAIIIMALCVLPAGLLKPSPRMRAAKLPAREKPLKAARAERRVPRPRRSTSAKAAARRLSTPLRGILHAPADAPPEAVLHEQRVATTTPSASS